MSTPTGYTPYSYPLNTALLGSHNPYFQFAQPAAVPAPPHRPPTPDPLSVTPEIATQTVQVLLTAELKEAGFESAHASAVDRLEQEVVAFVQKLYQRAHEYANLANRSGAVITDLMLACEDCSLPQDELRSMKTQLRKRKRKAVDTVNAPVLAPAVPRPESPDLLASDDESTPAVIPQTLKPIPSYLPNLPPKHTYFQTPASPPRRAALPSLEKKLKTASLVQDSLKNLMIATEDSSGQEDAELLGHIVNWQTAVHPRKRWKV